MAARTQLTVAGTGIVNLVRDSSVNLPAIFYGQVVDVTNGNYIACGSAAALQDARKILLAVTGKAVGTLTVRATGNGVDVSGNTQVSPYPSNAVFTQGSEGDMTATFAAGTTVTYVGPLTSDRFLQPDGNIYLDWNGGTGSFVAALQFPFNIV
jgi:hypothetical protein